MKHHLPQGIPFIISAPSGAGKTSICRAIRSLVPGLAYSVSYTTRNKRKGEEDGVDYFYVSAEIFKRMIEEEQFVEWAQVHGHYYGTSREFVNDKIVKGLDCLLDIDISGAKILKGVYAEGIFIFVIPPSLEELKARLSRRQTEKPDEIQLRLENAVSELGAFEEYQYSIVNDDFTRAVVELNAIILAERCRLQRRQPFVRELLASHTHR